MEHYCRESLPCPLGKWRHSVLFALVWLRLAAGFVPLPQLPQRRVFSIGLGTGCRPFQQHSKIRSVPNEIEQLMLEHDPILLYASRLLDQQTAADAGALYAWCRRLDEISDNPALSRQEKKVQIKEWEDRFDKLWDGKPVDAMDSALYQCLERHADLGREPFCDMMQGMKADTAENRRIRTMSELEEYGYQVAGTVGLMMLPLLKADAKLAREPAIALGQAIQLVNILRDATPDAALGRIYLPHDLLQEQNVKEEDIFALQSSKGYQAVVEQVAARSEELLLQAEVGKQSLPGFGPLLVQIIIELYRSYLEQLEKLDYNNLLPNRERVRISTVRKAQSTLKALKKGLSGN